MINDASRSAGNLDERGFGNITIPGAAATYGLKQTNVRLRVAMALI
ncbi:MULTISPECIES: hypothetical protein [unclassified Mesorhizobium]|nr:MULTISPECIES: hypothetical protein [unclassified Mesorhizobium]WJI68579.1 hypothetical protein NLY36_28000 [Mesorhizobium sp. C399B]